MNAVDTNVFAYAIDATDAIKHAKAVTHLQSLAQSSSPTILLWQVAGEFLNCLQRWSGSGYPSQADVILHMHDALAIFPLALPTKSIIDISMDLRTRHSLSHWHSMLLAACIVAGVDTLYSEDLTDGATYDTVTVVNPFV